MRSKHMRRALLGTFDRQDRFLDAGHLGHCDGLEKRALRQSTRMTMKAMTRLKISSASFQRPKSGEVKSAYHRHLSDQQQSPRKLPEIGRRSFFPRHIKQLLLPTPRDRRHAADVGQQPAPWPARSRIPCSRCPRSEIMRKCKPSRPKLIRPNANAAGVSSACGRC